MFAVDFPKSDTEIKLAVERDSVDGVHCFAVNRPGCYAFDDYGYPFYIRGIVKIDSEKALIAVNPGQGYFIFREQYENGIMPDSKLVHLEKAETVPFGELSDWLTIT